MGCGEPWSIRVGVRKSIWSLNVSPKARMFRACKDICPTRDNLCRKGLGSMAACPILNAEQEDAFHAPVQFPAALAYGLHVRLACIVIALGALF